jgi:hypothetical protein
MSTLLRTLALSGLLTIGGAAWACGDMAVNDSLAQMTRPTPNASVATKTPDAQELAQRADRRTPAKRQAATVKVASSPSVVCEGASCN